MKVLIHPRWFKQYEKLIFDMEDSSRNDRVDKMFEQLMVEQKFVNGVFTKMTARVGGKVNEDLQLED